MGKKIDALLGRKFKTSKFKATLNHANSRLSILKNHRHARLSIARSDLIQLLHLGHHERALLRIDQVIKEQNMLDVLEMIDGYCLLLLERVNLIEQEKECPDELKEAASSLLYASTRCGEFPELQEIRTVLTNRFGKEFTARAVELRNNSGVNTKMITKLSTRLSGLEIRLKMLKEIASENEVVLQIEDIPSSPKENQPQAEAIMNQGEIKAQDDYSIFTKEMEKIVSFSELMNGRKYRDAADAAQVAFESAAYAAAAARAAVELSHSEPFDHDDDHNGHDHVRSKPQSKAESTEVKELDARLSFKKFHHPENDDMESNEETINKRNMGDGHEQNKEGATVIEETVMLSDVEGHFKTMEKDLVFYGNDNENVFEQHGIKSPRNYDFGFDTNGVSLINEVSASEKFNFVNDEDMFGARAKTQIHLSSQ